MLPFHLVATVVVKKASIVYLSTQAVLDQLLTPGVTCFNVELQHFFAWFRFEMCNAAVGVNSSLVSYSVGFKCRY